MGSTRSGPSTTHRAMIEDSTEEFLRVSSGEESFSHPSPRRCDMGALLTPITTMTWMEDTPAAQATAMVPPWMAASRPEASLSSERHHAHHGG
jgi:hypothetical protein